MGVEMSEEDSAKRNTAVAALNGVSAQIFKNLPNEKLVNLHSLIASAASVYVREGARLIESTGDYAPVHKDVMRKLTELAPLHIATMKSFVLAAAEANYDDNEIFKKCEDLLHAIKRDAYENAKRLFDTDLLGEYMDHDLFWRMVANKIYKNVTVEVRKALFLEIEQRGLITKRKSEEKIKELEGKTNLLQHPDDSPTDKENDMSNAAPVSAEEKKIMALKVVLGQIDMHIEEARKLYAAAYAKFADASDDIKRDAEDMLNGIAARYNNEWAQKSASTTSPAELVSVLIVNPFVFARDHMRYVSNEQKDYVVNAAYETVGQQAKQVVHNLIVKLETDYMVNSPTKAVATTNDDTNDNAPSKENSSMSSSNEGGALTKSLAQTDPAKGPKVTINNVEVVHHQGHLMLPIGLSIPDAIEVLKRRHAYMNEMTTMVEVIDAFPWDGALAMQAVLADRYGWTPPPAASVSVEVGFNKTARIPWGKFTVPGLKADMHTGVTFKDGLLAMKLEITVLNLHKAEVLQIMDQVRDYCTKNSIYRGQAITIKFHDENNNKMMIPEIHFLDTTKIKPDQLIYSKEVREAIETNLFTPIRRVHELHANGIPVKRGVLLGGPFGTGKTLAAEAAAKFSTENGLTYIYVRNTRELPDAISFSLRYQDPAAVVFAEDIDRTTDGERDINVDQILNLVDGVETKHRNLILVFTTNEIDNIEPAMMRPGRLDAVIEVTAPDAEAAGKLVLLYGGDALASDVDIDACGHALQGMIPAVISEVMRRAKLAQLSRTPEGHLVDGIGTEAIIESAHTMRRQVALLQPKKEEQSTAEKVLVDFGKLLDGEKPASRRVA